MGARLKQGREYEQFVYEKFRRLFAGSVVTQNDRIIGKESGVEREIDVSVKSQVGSEELLYIVQCKDRKKRPADIIILGEFSAVIRDVGAAKGFLVCTSGFAKTNHQYALTLGIELVTVEDINSERWKVDIQIPVVYVRKSIDYVLNAGIVVNQALAEKNRNAELEIHFDISTLRSTDGGLTAVPIKADVEAWLANPPVVAAKDALLDLLRPTLQVEVASVWVDCDKLTVRLTLAKTFYLKYVTPDEYSQIRDHVRDTVLPLHVAVTGVVPVLDETFVEVPGDELPVFPNLWLVFEEWTDLERAQGRTPGAGRATA